MLVALGFSACGRQGDPIFPAEGAPCPVVHHGELALEHKDMEVDGSDDFPDFQLGDF